MRLDRYSGKNSAWTLPSALVIVNQLRYFGDRRSYWRHSQKMSPVKQSDRARFGRRWEPGLTLVLICLAVTWPLPSVAATSVDDGAVIVWSRG